MLREWLWRGGRLRIGVTSGLFFGICMGAGFYWLASPLSAAAAAIGGVLCGAAFGTVMAVSSWGGGWLRLRQLSELPPSDRVAVLGAVMRGEPVSDPRLAPGVLAHAEMVVAWMRRQQAPWRRWALLAFAVLELVMAIWKTIAGPAWQAVVFWIFAAMFLGFGWAAPWALRRLYERAQAAADFVDDQIALGPSEAAAAPDSPCGDTRPPGSATGAPYGHTVTGDGTTVIIDHAEHGAKIIFARPGGSYRDAFRSYSLEVDDVPRGRINPGQTVAIDVEPGLHTVRARIDWTGSPRQEVNLGPGEEVRLRVEPTGTPVQALWQVVGRTRYLRITAEPS